jgi:tetratricopeptide (TPR) repeat protein
MNRSWLRWTVPPGISLLVHALLLAIVAYIGMQISAAQAPEQRVAITELALPAPPSVPETRSQDPTPPNANEAPARSLPSAPQLPDMVESQAETLERNRPSAAPTMDPVTLEAMRETTSTIARPESTSPPSVAFAGVQSKAARTLVYVVDGSGATANSFAYLQTQLMRSIDRLSPTQRFQVVLFRESDDSAYTLAPINSGKLARATPQHKQAVADWLDSVSARGRSNPLDGLKGALALKPDLVLLITRSIQRTEMGWAQGQREILQTLNALNPQDPISGQRSTVIKCVQLLDEDPTGIMNAIGSLHGDGVDDYKVVRYEDLVSSDEPQRIAERSIGASDEQRIATAAQIWGELAQSGTTQSVLTSVADRSQRMSVTDAAQAVRSLTAQLREQDGRAELLWAQATLALHKADALREPEPALRSITQALGPVMYTDPATDAQRIITIALARDTLGERAQAAQRLRELVELSDELELDALTRAQALLALVSIGEEPETLSAIAAQPPFTTPTGNIDALWGLLLREGVTIARLNREADNAWAPMLRVRDAAHESQGIVDYIDQRLALIYETHAPPRDPTPTTVLMAAAHALSRSIATRERALALYDRVANDPDAAPAHPEALWQLGVLGRAIGDADTIEHSNAALTRLAREYPGDPRALGAISSAIGSTSEHEHDALIDRLSLAIETFPESPAIDLWRLKLAELREDFARLDTLEPIRPETREGVLAGELYEQTVMGMLDRYNDPQVRSGLERRMQLAAKRFGLPSVDLWTKRSAISASLHDPQGALGNIDTLIKQAESSGEPSEELRMLRAQTLLRLDQTQAAFAELRELIARSDANANYSSTYWQSWALILESVAEHGNAADKTEARRHLARLQLIDPELGGSPWRERLHDARETLHSEP